MAEYIEREAALSAQNKSMNLAECRKRLERLPAADVAPVVRCGECEHWWDNGTDLCSCERDALLRRRDFFCADGKRKDGDGARSNERT